MSTVAAATTTALVSPVAANSSQPPIVYFFHLLQQVISACLALIAFVFRTATSLLPPITTAWFPVAYAMGPVVVLTNILLDVFVITPYRIITYILHALYPVYVLVGIAFICSCIIGLGARIVIYVVKMLLLRPSSKVQPPDIQITQAEEEEKPRKKLQRRVSIKEERLSPFR